MNSGYFFGEDELITPLQDSEGPKCPLHIMTLLSTAVN